MPTIIHLSGLVIAVPRLQSGYDYFVSISAELQSVIQVSKQLVIAHPCLLNGFTLLAIGTPGGCYGGLVADSSSSYM